jgi:hypothetical protein
VAQSNAGAGKIAALLQLDIDAIALRTIDLELSLQSVEQTCGRRVQWSMAAVGAPFSMTFINVVLQPDAQTASLE